MDAFARTIKNRVSHKRVIHSKTGLTENAHNVLARFVSCEGGRSLLRDQLLRRTIYDCKHALEMHVLARRQEVDEIEDRLRQIFPYSAE